MEENSKKTLVVNTVLLYSRLIITAICGLFATRFSLQALGVNDYGIFSVVGGIISFIAILNTIMVTSSNRFIAVEIGKGNIESINKQFNVNVIIHLFIAVVVLLFAYPIGWWYINHYVSYSGDLNNVFIVFNLSLLGSAISFLSVPYNGLLIAKEKFLVFCSVDVVSSVVRLVFSYLLIFYFQDKLITYTLVTTILTIYPTLVFFLYCYSKYKELVRFRFIKDVNSYKCVLSFSTWIGMGAVASVGKSQGSALIINAFFNTVMNAALALANSVNVILMTLSNSITKSIAPQITKNYAKGNFCECENLVILSTRISYLFMLFISVPFLVVPDFIFHLWLGSVPEYVILFTQLIIADTLVRSLNAGVLDLVFATGNIKWYQIIESSLLIASVVVGFFLLKYGYEAYYLLLSYVFFSFVVTIVRQIILNKLVKFDIRRLYKESYLPSVIITASFLLVIWLLPNLQPVVLLIITWFILLSLIITFGIRKKELTYIANKIKTIIR